MPPGGQYPADVKSLLTSGLARACQYAGARPGCQGIAVICYGPAALCATCDKRRSTLGKGTRPVALPDPRALLEITAASRPCDHAGADLRDAVLAGRRAAHPLCR